MFPEHDSVYELIRLIYESANDPRQWPLFLERFAALSGVAPYAGYDSAQNPWTTRSGRFWESGNGAPNHEVSVGEFCDDYLRPQAWSSAKELRLLAALMPHLRGALRIRRRIEAVEEKLAALSDAMDLLPGGVIIAEAGARVLATNRAAARILAGKDGLKDGAGGLSAQVTVESNALRATIAEAAACEDGWRAPTPMAISRDSGRRPLQVSVAPLPTQTGGLRRPAMAVLFVSEPDKGPETDQAFLQRAFALTEGEARVSAALTQGKSVEEIALASGVTQGAVRTHLKRVFSKTGTRRQGELISLLMKNGGALRVNGGR